MKSQHFIQSLRNEVINEKFVITHVLIPLVVSVIYSLILTLLIPPGVNKTFVDLSIRIFLPISILLIIGYLVLPVIRGNKLRLDSIEKEKFYAGDLLLPLFPLTPVVHYLINNSDIVSWFEIILIILLFYFLVSLPIVVVPRLFNRSGAAIPLMSMGLAYSFLITSMALLAAYLKWYQEGSFLIQLLIVGVIWIFSWILFKFKMRNLLYLFIVVNFAFNSIMQILNQDLDYSSVSQDLNDNRLMQMVGAKQPEKLLNIYLLVYDSYVNSDTMIGYGIDNTPQEDYLAGQGFKIYPRTYSYWGFTIDTMSRVLNSSDDYYGDKRRALSGDGVVQNLLKEYGYKTYGVFSWDYYSRGRIPSYDYSYPESTSAFRLLIKAILMGELRFDLVVNSLSQEEYINLKQTILSELPDVPRFIYAHSNYPGHSQNSGNCRPDETQLFADRLAAANVEMQQDIAAILENDPGAIVIVAGDHGPSLTKNCLPRLRQDSFDISEISRLDIQDRLGTFLAIRWPSSDFEAYDEITILQDLFPAIFAYLLDDPQLLKAKMDFSAPVTTDLAGIELLDGIIYGGIHDGEELFPIQ